jgi:hypothetical protein
MEKPKILQAEPCRTDSLWQLHTYELLFLLYGAIDTLIAHLHAIRASWLFLTALQCSLSALIHPVVVSHIGLTLTLRVLQLKHPPRLLRCALILRFLTARLSSLRLRGESFLASVGDILCSIIRASRVYDIVMEFESDARKLASPHQDGENGWQWSVERHTFELAFACQPMSVKKPCLLSSPLSFLHRKISRIASFKI